MVLIRDASALLLRALQLRELLLVLQLVGRLALVDLDLPTQDDVNLARNTLEVGGPLAVERERSPPLRVPGQRCAVPGLVTGIVDRAGDPTKRRLGRVYTRTHLFMTFRCTSHQARDLLRFELFAKLLLCGRLRLQRA